MPYILSNDSVMACSDKAVGFECVKDVRAYNSVVDGLIDMRLLNSTKALVLRWVGPRCYTIRELLTSNRRQGLENYAKASQRKG